MGDGLKGRCVGRVYGAVCPVRLARHHPHGRVRTYQHSGINVPKIIKI